MLDFHNFQLSVDPAGDPAVTGHGDTTPTAADSAGDPEIEKLEYNIPAETSHGDNTPTAAWILLSLFLLSCLQKHTVIMLLVKYRNTLWKHLCMATNATSHSPKV